MQFVAVEVRDCGTVDWIVSFYTPEACGSDPVIYKWIENT